MEYDSSLAFSEAPGLRRRYRPALPALPGGRGASRGPAPAAAGGDGHRRCTRAWAWRPTTPASGPCGCWTSSAGQEGGRPSCGTTRTSPTTARPGYGRALRGPARRADRARGRPGPGGRAGRPGRGGAPGRRARGAPHHRPPAPRRAHLPQGGAGRRGRRRSRGVVAPRDAARAGPGGSPPAGAWRGWRARATPTSTTSTTPSCCPRPCGWRASAGGRWSTTCTSTSARPPAPSGGCPARCGCRVALAAERAERLGARRLAGVVTANEDLAARFAAAGRARRERHELALVRRVPRARRRCPPSRTCSTWAGSGRCAAWR